MFGSYARGTQTEGSDIDFLVDTTGTALTSFFLLGALYSDLEAAFETFASDADYQRSVSFCVLQIGELAVGLSEEYRAKTASRIQWGPIKGMRNWVAHNYANISLDIVWETAVNDIPALKQFCEEQSAGESEK